MTPRWRSAVLLFGASLLISTTAVRSTRAERAETAGPATFVIEAQASNYIGMGGCTSANCHTSVKEWAQRLDGDGKPKGKQHINAANQLEARTYKAVTDYVKAVGGSNDPYENQTCVRCHTVPLAGGDFEGITCEKCHGPGKGYKEKHDKVKGAGAAPYVKDGMIDYGKNPAKWVPLCIDCHVLTSRGKEPALAAAGHPTGADFDIVQAYKKVGNPSHWATRNYASAEVAKYKPAAKPIAPAPPPVTPPAAAVTPTPAPPGPPTPAPPVATPAPNPGPPTPPTPGPGPRTAATPAPAPVNAIVAPVPPPPVAPATKPRVTPMVAPPPAATDPRPMPAPEAPPVTAAPPVGTPSSEPRTMSGLVASVQGRLINVLTSLLRQNATVPQRVVPPAKPAAYSGPDRDLLKLQDDIISLALEVLGKAPGKGGGS